MRFTAVLSLLFAAIAFAGVVRKDENGAVIPAPLLEDTVSTADSANKYEPMLYMYEDPL
jgi:hypothetical protein